MDDQLIDDERLPVSRRSIIPGEGFFVPDEIEKKAEEQEAQAALEGADVAIVTDTDADGLACAALVREARGEAALLGSGPHELAESLERVAEYGEPGLELFVCDLCPDDYDEVATPLETLVERTSAVHWFDHHQWAEKTAAAVRNLGVNLVVGESDEECTADVTVRAMDHDFADHLVELAAVTRDHDLWIKDDPRSDDLADYARWSEDDVAYIDTVREHGPDMPAAVMELLAEHRELKAALIDRAVGRAELHEIGPWTVGVTYGRCSQNEVAEAMREQGADASVIVKPAGSVSLRGSDGFERSHEVAGKLNGGGHPKAAGCKPDIYDDMLDMANHWTTRGATAKQVVLDAFRERRDELEAAGELES